MSYEKIDIQISENKTITIETGKLAKQADGSVVVRLGDTMALVTVCVGEERDVDFFPLTVEYREKTYAAGKFPGGYLKRESRPSDKEVLTCRLIDRPLRPLFPKNFKNEVQIATTIINSDGKNDADAIAILGASCAVGLSSLPLEKLIAAVRVCRINGEFIVAPTYADLEDADLDMMVAGSEDSIVMVEGGAYEVSEQVMVDGITAGHEVIKKLVAAQQELISRVQPEKIEVSQAEVNAELFAKVEEMAVGKLKEAFHIPMTKKPHYKAMKAIKQTVLKSLEEAYPEQESEIEKYFSEIEKREMREMILAEQVRLDGRKLDEVRAIEVENELLPNTHGSALFQRGETQAMVVCTLGGKTDEQKMDNLQGDWYKNYYLHYNFPPYSVGETGRFSGPGRREIGHGQLAERSLAPVLPTSEFFPYTIRVVSEILESHGSSSMASVCGGSLALMDAGVPIKTAVSGIAMGLISDGERVRILSDITGTEDHLGDMDFKVCGTSEGVTGFQMDIKISGITPELMLSALNQARDGRLHILGKMNEVLDKPRELSKLAPAIIKKKIPVEKIKDVIGPGGKVIRGIQEESGVNLDVNDEGEVTITAPKRGNANRAIEMIDELFREVEIGQQYSGKVKNITNFGAFVEVLPGKEGLVHISEMDLERGKRVEDVLNTGDVMEVKCINIDHQGRVRLSQKQANQPA
ncbi:polyribonucleotide nucleotidyltransferase [Fibrobacterota bacterium]